jgi:hypothetical protein
MNTEFPTYFSSKHALSMELRDYFAAKVMHYWLTHPMSTIHIENMCKGAYQVADAMMEARKEKK